MPALVGRPLIGRANSYFEAVYSMGYIVGPAIAGVLAATIGPGADARHRRRCRSWLSAVGLLFVRRDLRAPVDRPRERLVHRDPRRHRLHRRPARCCAARSCSGARPRSCTAPLVLALRSTSRATSATPPSVLGAHPGRRTGSGPSTGSLVSARRIGRGPCRRGPHRREPAFGVSLAGRRPSPSSPGPGRGRGRGRDRPVDDPRHVHHAPDGLLARRAPGPDRQHGPDDLARASSRSACSSAARSSTLTSGSTTIAVIGHRPAARQPRLRAGAARCDAPRSSRAR